MCGILGVCLDITTSRSADDILRLKTDFADLLAAAEVRGTDAAGVYIVNKDSEIVYHKAPVAGSVLADDDTFWKMLNDFVSEKTVAIIGHTRFATHGDPADNDNNHPIFDTPIIGVHNGMIRNHERLNTRYRKAAEVDSAAIMSLLRVKSKNKPMTLSTLSNNLHQLEGPFAIAVADTRKPDGIFMARNTNPVKFFRERDAGLLWFASTSEILNDGIGAPVDKTFSMPADHCCRIDSKAVAGKLKYRSIKSSDPGSELSAVATTPRIPREVRQYEVRQYSGSTTAALTDAWTKPIKKKKSKKIKQAKVCSKCNEIINTVYMGGIEQDCCGCVSISDMISG
jgi:asparagine synthetase B (glutamine-hydrolysing)